MKLKLLLISLVLMPLMLVASSCTDLPELTEEEAALIEQMCADICPLESTYRPQPKSDIFWEVVPGCELPDPQILYYRRRDALLDLLRMGPDAIVIEDLAEFTHALSYLNPFLFKTPNVAADYVSEVLATEPFSNLATTLQLVLADFSCPQRAEEIQCNRINMLGRFLRQFAGLMIKSPHKYGAVNLIIDLKAYLIKVIARHNMHWFAWNLEKLEHAFILASHIFCKKTTAEDLLPIDMDDE